MLTDTIPQSIITEANIFNQSVEEKQRREEAIKNIDFYYSKQEKYINRLNTDVDLVTINLMNPIIKKKVSLLYSNPLKREYVGPNKSINLIEDIYSKLKIDKFLQSVDLAAELTGTGLVFVGIDDNGQIYLRLYDASEISVIQNIDDIDNPSALSLCSIVSQLTGSSKNPDMKKYIRAQVWTNDYITIFNDGIKQSNSQPNPLGYLPFVPFKGEDVYNQFLGHAPAESIQQLNGYINQQLTNLGYMIKMESATPVVLTGFENGEGVIVHPGKAISMPIGGSATTLNFNPKIMDTLEEIKYLENKIFETAGIPKVSVIGDEKATSGKELQIKWAPLIEVYKDKALRYESYELNLANMILKVLDEQPIEHINIKFNEKNILPIMDTTDRDSDIKYGLSTPVDELMRIDPNLTETEAEAIVISNIQFNRTISGAVKVDPKPPVNN